MANFHVEVIDETGERRSVPLWKFPQMCADDVACKASLIAAAKAEKEAFDLAMKKAEQARLETLLKDEQAVTQPYDLATGKVSK